MKKAKIGLIGLIGDEMKQDFWGTMEHVAQIGYQGIEGGPIQLLDGDAKENFKKFHELGLRVLTASASREDLRDNLQTVISNAKALNTSRVTVWWGPCHTKDELLRDAELYNYAGKRLAEEGLQLCYHHHDHEFKTTFNGVYAFDILAEHTDPKALSFEVDIAWVTFGREDPVKVIRRMADRIPAIHVKDVLNLEGAPKFTGLGTGIVKIKESVEAAIESGIEWIVVEQDHLRHLSAMDTITLSFLHLREMGLI